LTQVFAIVIKVHIHLLIVSLLTRSSFVRLSQCLTGCSLYNGVRYWLYPFPFSRPHLLAAQFVIMCSLIGPRDLSVSFVSPISITLGFGICVSTSTNPKPSSLFRAHTVTAAAVMIHHLWIPCAAFCRSHDVSCPTLNCR